MHSSQAFLGWNSLKWIWHYSGTFIVHMPLNCSMRMVNWLATCNFRITGLDPAGPLADFFPRFFGGAHLSALSAVFVDIVKTDSTVYGHLFSIGTVNFFVNGGIRPQPGCEVITVPLSLSAAGQTKMFQLNSERKWQFTSFIPQIRAAITVRGNTGLKLSQRIQHH